MARHTHTHEVQLQLPLTIKYKLCITTEYLLDAYCLKDQLDANIFLIISTQR